MEATLPRRADALRNRRLVLEAAAAVMAERGLDAPVPEIAARAGVGKATVYRSFPTKEHLVAAILVQRLRWFEAQARDAAAAPDAGAAFRALLRTTAEAYASDRALAGVLLRSIGLPEVQSARRDAARALGRVMRLAREQGALRAGAGPADVRILFGGAARALADEGERDPAVWRRYADRVADALSPPARSAP